MAVVLMLFAILIQLYVIGRRLGEIAQALRSHLPDGDGRTG